MYSLTATPLFLTGIYLIIIVNNNISSFSYENKTIKIRGKYRIGPHDKDVLSIIHGSLLGDGHAEKRLTGIGTRITFYQEHSHLKYLHYLHNVLSEKGYCNDKIPTIKQRLGVGGKVRKVGKFATWTYTSFNWIHNEWYKNGKKCVPIDIDKYLTPLALAIWIMDDGSKVSKGLKFSTNSFTFEECTHLSDVLYKNFKLKSSVQSAGAKDQYIVYIWKESMKDLVSIVFPYIIPEMKYKIAA